MAIHIDTYSGTHKETRTVSGKGDMENSNIAWTHNTQNFWLGCDKIAPECAHCYIGRVLRQQQREPWGQLYRTKTWNNPAKWQRQAESQGICYRVFTNSLSDFFHAKADAWREEAWKIIRDTPNLVWLILTKRPELVASRLPKDWGEGYPNVWLGTSVGCNQTLNKMDTLRKIPATVRFVSCEPLLEDIADGINLEGFRWLIVGGESGDGQEYLWDKTKDWRREFDTSGRRTMKIEWAQRLLEKSHATGVSFFFKQVTSFRSGVGEDALGRIYHEFPPAPHGKWADKTHVEGPALVSIATAEKATETPIEIRGTFNRTPPSEKISQETPTTDSKTTIVRFDQEEELKNLCDEADTKAKELVGLYHVLQVRISGELFPLLLRIRTLLLHGEWTPWYENFCKRHHITTSMKTVQRAFKTLTTDDRLLTDGKPVAKPSQKTVTTAEPEAVTTARAELAELEEQIGTSPTGEGAKQLHEEYKKKLADAVAASTSPVSADSPTPVEESRIVISPTARLEVPPPPTVQDKHGHAALYNAAQVAAVTAANAVTDADIKSRFYPVLMFLTDRSSVTFGRYLKSIGINNHGPHGEKWRGRTCFYLPTPEPFHTYEEALAYVEAFAKALPNLDICYGVDVLCMDDDGGYGGWRERKRQITRRNEPASIGGG